MLNYSVAELRDTKNTKGIQLQKFAAAFFVFKQKIE